MKTNPASLLIVDDDEDTRLNLADIFGDLGYHVETAHNGASALAVAGRRTFDLALIDLMLPGMDGLDVYRRLHILSPKTAAVLITGEPHHPRALHSFAVGINHVIPKPLDIPPLAELLARMSRDA